jgi:hypothetical protein
MNADGTGQTRLTNTPPLTPQQDPNSTTDNTPVFSPDGKKIAFTRRFDPYGGNTEHWTIYTMNADGSAQTQLAVDPNSLNHPTSPRWQPIQPPPPPSMPPPGGGTILGAPPFGGSVFTGPVAGVAKTSDLSVSPSAFFAAGSGPSALSARRTGTRVSYTLNVAASVRFTVERPVRGRKVKDRCVPQRKSNRRRPSCRRYSTVRGSFTLQGNAGVNRFRFTGRLAGRKLRPGSYRLVATPSVAGRAGTPTRTSFRIRRP